MKIRLFTVVILFFIASIPLESNQLESDNISLSIYDSVCSANRNETWTVGLIYCTDSIEEGYTLFSPMASNTSYLIDHYGREVHHWISPGNHRPGMSAYLLDDGELLRTANLGNNQPGEFTGGGSAGKVERISWEGELEWSWTYSSELYRSHHDIEPLPNGNFLMIAWEYRNESEAAEAGKYPQDDSSRALGTSSVWPDRIIEVKPVGTENAEIVWQWTFWDHLIQDYDPTKANFGVVSEHPELLDVNFIDAVGSASGGRDWLHCNGIDYNPILDQIAISCKNTNEIYIIDHSTTTEEASGHSGGNSGMGGDILYRYGNPESYQRGGPEDQVSFAQHDIQWIQPGFPDEGKMMLFNNGNGRDTLYSSVDVIETPINGSGYDIDSIEPYGPNNLSWTWDVGVEMYSSAISGSTRLSNGNTLITFGMQGTLIEVDYSGEIVWKYISPVNNLGIMTQGDSIFTGNGNKVFKVTRHYAFEPALKGKVLEPIDYIENWQDNCPDEESLPHDVDGDGCIDDTDNDGINDSLDVCPDFDDNIDVDNDIIPDGCDSLIDSDYDSVSDSEDLCPGYDDNIDLDNDGIPDDCDNLIDSDKDDVADINDLCPGYDDNIDLDDDGVPDNCDDIIDSDFDGVPNDLDLCSNSSLANGLESNPNGCDLSQIDTDDDGINDFDDRCEGYDDNIDKDSNQIPDGCEDNSNFTEKETLDDRIELLSPLNISIMVFILFLFGILLRRNSSA